MEKNEVDQARDRIIDINADNETVTVKDPKQANPATPIPSTTARQTPVTTKTVQPTL